jgi:hypothetical protein
MVYLLIKVNPQYSLTSYKVNNLDTLVYLNLQDYKRYINQHLMHLILQELVVISTKYVTFNIQ